MTTLYPLLFEDNFHNTVWGGSRIHAFKGMPCSDDMKVGESWEVSAVNGKDSVVANGELAGSHLCTLVEQYGSALLGKKVAEKYNNQFPLLAKFIGAESDLSIQVHPDDKLAFARHNCFGKNEMWMILDCKPGAKIYSGFKDQISKYEYCKRVEDGSLCEVLQDHPVHSGDIFYIPAGRVHAIGEGILLAEIQQSSDITYRIFDYGRTGLDGKPRELHTALAEDAIDFNVEADYRTHYSIRKNKPTHAITSPFFQVNVLKTDGAITRHLKKCDSFIIYMCTRGTCTIHVEKDPTKQVQLTAGFSCLIPAECADVVITPTTPEAHSCELVESFIDNYEPWHMKLAYNVGIIKKVKV